MGVAHCFKAIWPPDIIVGKENSITETGTHTLKDVTGLTYTSSSRVETRRVNFISGSDFAAFNITPTVVVSIS